MPNLDSILWVVPGFLFVYFFNKYRPQESIDLSGWPYVFFVVFIATLTWLPAEWITKKVPLTCNVNEECVLCKLAISMSLALILLSFSRNKKILKYVFPSVHDHFYKNCVAWENEIVLLTLKNCKAYIGFLWKYPENPRSKYESQTVSIVPIRSGYRREDTKQIVWNTNYPEYEKESDFVDMELMIPRSEILTYGKFNEKTFNHFYHNKT